MHLFLKADLGLVCASELSIFHLSLSSKPGFTERSEDIGIVISSIHELAQKIFTTCPILVQKVFHYSKCPVWEAADDCHRERNLIDVWLCHAAKLIAMSSEILVPKLHKGQSSFSDGWIIMLLHLHSALFSTAEKQEWNTTNGKWVHQVKR